MAYPSGMDSIGVDNPIPREAGQRKRSQREVATGTTGGSSLGEGTPIPGYDHGAPIRTRRDDLIDASRARRGGRAGPTYPSGGCLDRAGLGTHAGRKRAPAQARPPIDEGY